MAVEPFANCGCSEAFTLHLGLEMRRARARQCYGSPYVPPKHTGTITVGARALDQKLTLGGRIFFAGERYLESTSNRFKQIWDPFVVYDLFGSYEVNEHFRIDGSVENITDLYYFDPLTTASVPSPGRTARVSATARF